jgi:hypothetical protein
MSNNKLPHHNIWQKAVTMLVYRRNKMAEETLFARVNLSHYYIHTYYLTSRLLLILTDPIEVEYAFLVHSLESMRTEVISLSLQQISW